MMKPADVARLVLLGGIWGSSFLLIKIALETYPPLHIVGGRVVIAAVVLVAIARAKGIRLPSDPEAWKAVAVVAVVSNLVPFFLIAWGQERITASLTSILNSTTPLFTALAAFAFLSGESMNRLRATGVLLGFVGVGVIVGLDLEGSSLVGQLAVVAAAASYGLGFVYVKAKLSGRGGSPVALSAAQLIVGAALITIPTGADMWRSAPGFDLGGLAAIAVLGALGTGIAYTIYYRLIEDVGATSASFVTYLIPLFGVTLGYVFLGERLGWDTFIGGALVIAGITTAERGGRRAKQALAPVGDGAH